MMQSESNIPGKDLAGGRWYCWSSTSKPGLGLKPCSPVVPQEIAARVAFTRELALSIPAR